tara:strand:+ start:216 stop:734 length:519 start_codon:yes stop_codon:yes gene_type:complete
MSTLTALAIVAGGMYYYQHKFTANPTTPSTGNPPTKRGGKHTKESDIPAGPKSGRVEVMKVHVSKQLSVEAQASTAKQEAQERLARAEGGESNWEWKSALAATGDAISSLFNKSLNTSLEVDTDLKKQVAVKNNAAITGQSGVVGMGNADTMHLEESTIVPSPVTHPPEQLP